MTITINVPVFPLRKEIAARKRRRGFPMSFSLRGCASAAREENLDPRYTEDGLEFDVTGIARPPRGSRGG
ncbi:hypothetical protein ABLE93_12170 [Xanthobacter sp. KR7-65]|uniref:hypothetical protein n=1 Tax=Xanthobacter sp. KR7-65 TaxID=3156612 RepID=UPI0032B50EC3